MNADRPYLEHILQAITKIRRYTVDGHDAFLQDPKTQDAVLRNFEIIGEAAKQLSDDTKARRREIDWRSVAGLRDVLIHNYMGVNLERIWAVIDHDLAPLQKAIESLLGMT